MMGVLRPPDDAIPVAQSRLQAGPDEGPGGFERWERRDARAQPPALTAIAADHGVVIQQSRLPGDAVVAPRVGCGVDAHQLNGGEVDGRTIPLSHSALR